jgi:hypothetical protein
MGQSSLRAHEAIIYEAFQCECQWLVRFCLDGTSSSTGSATVQSREISPVTRRDIFDFLRQRRDRGGGA